MIVDVLRISRADGGMANGVVRRMLAFYVT